MSHVVLDGNGSLKYILSLDTGVSSDPIRLISMPYHDAMIDLGVIFTHSDRHTVANNATFTYLMKTPASPAHIELLEVSVDASASPIYIDFYENAIVSANGTQEFLLNNNRQSSASSTTLLYMGPTITSVGDEIFHLVNSGDKTTGGFVEHKHRTILKPSCNYLVQFQNVSGVSSVLGLTIQIGED